MEFSPGRRPGLWEAVRDSPVTREVVYLNHAGVSPLVSPPPTRNADLAEDAARSGSSITANGWPLRGLRVAAARLIGGAPARDSALDSEQSRPRQAWSMRSKGA